MMREETQPIMQRDTTDYQHFQPAADAFECHPPTTIDALLVQAGGFGCFQRRLLAAAAAVFGLSAIYIVLPTLLLPRHLNAEWHLSSAEDGLVSTVFFAGNTLGLLALGLVGDLHGRRPALLIGLVCLILGGAVLLTAPGVPQLLVSRAIAGFGAGGALNCTFLLLLEYCTPEHRTLSKVAIASLGWVPGILYACAVAYALDDASWQAFALAALAPSLPILLAAWLVFVESPRFALAAHGRAEAMAILSRVARANGHTLPSEADVADAALTAEKVDVCEAVQLLLSRQLRGRAALVGLAWFGSTCVYYGVVLAPVQLADDLYLETALGALLEVPAYLLMQPMGNRCGRRLTLAFFLAVAGASLLLAGLLPESSPSALLVAAGLTARFGAAGASAFVYVVAAEQFPTRVRTTALGYGAACGRIASMLAPMLVNLVDKPTVYLAGIAVAAMLAAMNLPETAGGKLLESEDEAGVARLDGSTQSWSPGRDTEAAAAQPPRTPSAVLPEDCVSAGR